MINKKITMGAAKTIKTLYINGNMEARGGKREIQETVHYHYKSGYVNNPFYTGDVCADSMIKGQYYKKNAYQRRTTRCRVVEELVSNNFQHHKSMFITLTFDPNKVSPEDNPILEKKEESEELPECPDWPGEVYPELDLVKISNELFGDGSEEDSEDVSNTLEECLPCQDIKYCNKKFKQFIQRMNYWYDNFKYVAVMSTQKNGNWHYHMICNLQKIPYSDLLKIWRVGGAYIHSIKSEEEMQKEVRYMFKNISAASYELEGEKGYLASKGLHRYVEYRSWVDSEKASVAHLVATLNRKEKEGLKVSSRRISEHTYEGEIRGNNIFVETEERKCIRKEYAFNINLEYPYPLLESAVKRHRK